MPSLYHRLFTYRERPERSPLEDFLTEALADILNRLPEEVARSFVGKLFSDHSVVSDQLARLWPLGAEARWVTQKGVSNGKIADLVLEVARTPVLVIENKVSAGFRSHTKGGDGSEPSRQNQLATYGQWVQQESPQDWGGALVLLTHWTPPPPDFWTSPNFAARHRAVMRWSDLSRWLSRASETPAHATAGWAELTRDFLSFLREKNMDSELATGFDWAALQVYIPSADRVRNTIERLWSAAESSWRPICIQTSHVTQISSEYGCVWKFRYLNRSDLRQTYLAVGVRFAFNSDYLADVGGRGKTSNLFVELSTEGKERAFEELKLTGPWLIARGIRLCEKPLSDLSTEPDGFVVEAQRWTQDRIQEIASAVQGAAVLLGQSSEG